MKGRDIEKKRLYLKFNEMLKAHICSFSALTLQGEAAKGRGRSWTYPHRPIQWDMLQTSMGGGP